VVAAQGTNIVDATDLAITAQYEGGSQVTRQRTITDKRGQGHEIAVTVKGWKLIVLIEVRTKIPLAPGLFQSSPDMGVGRYPRPADEDALQRNPRIGY
jgi:hypothetical protein